MAEEKKEICKEIDEVEEKVVGLYKDFAEASHFEFSKMSIETVEDWFDKLRSLTSCGRTWDFTKKIREEYLEE